MLKFVKRKNNPADACQVSDYTYWDVFDKSKKVGWFGIFNVENKTYTDIRIVPRLRGKGYFKQVYDYFLEHHWDYQINLYAFVGHDNRSSIRAHEKYGCKIFKHNQSTDTYLVFRRMRNENRNRDK